ncbi:quinoprotein relay system zinc metallohydrolase 1 [Salinisphaera sp. T31B1]|uniref:quinoprotein relay system zinc metallohydrolase 1 n=1 Tax=Salinisphaera sp. T31B1 TaxID=727963 RepID=UPI003341D7AB
MIALAKRLRWRVLVGLGMVLCHSAAAFAADYYDLHPQQIAADTYVFYGAQENFSFDNHGAIANTGFIVTDAGVIVIDTGPSRLYGRAMRAAIARVTDRPIAQVYITHAHPDHFLGNNAFEDVPIATLAGTIDQIKRIGPDLASNLYNLVGPAMRGTTARAPDQVVADGDTVVFGRHRLSLIGMRGHTGADLMVLDRTTGVLFAGDIAFYQRAATTPNADIARWEQSLAAAEQLDFRYLVPGHGPVTEDGAPLLQTAAYLNWLVSHFEAAAAVGRSEAEVLYDRLPPRWARLAVEPSEYQRSVSHLYPAIEQRSLSAPRAEGGAAAGS